jgi:hypothetical protein
MPLRTAGRRTDLAPFILRPRIKRWPYPLRNEEHMFSDKSNRGDATKVPCVWLQPSFEGEGAREGSEAASLRPARKTSQPDRAALLALYGGSGCARVSSPDHRALDHRDAPLPGDRSDRDGHPERLHHEQLALW